MVNLDELPGSVELCAELVSIDIFRDESKRVRLQRSRRRRTGRASTQRIGLAW